jgi:hypothetical protein
MRKFYFSFLTVHTLVLIGESIHIFLNKCNQTLLKGCIFTSTIVRVKNIGALTRAGLKTSYSYTNICVICNFRVHLFHEKMLLFSGPSTLIEVNMQVRSMGPISEMDMVSINVIHILIRTSTGEDETKWFSLLPNLL